MRLFVPTILVLLSAACSATPERYCEAANDRCLEDAGWTTSDVNECIYSWEGWAEEADDAGCDQPFQEYFDCRDAEAYCWEETDTDGTVWTIYGIDEYTCQSEFDAYLACMD